MLQTRLVETLKEKQESHEKLTHIKKEKMEKNINEIIFKFNGIKVDEQIQLFKKLCVKNIFGKRINDGKQAEEQTITHILTETTFKKNVTNLISYWIN